MSEEENEETNTEDTGNSGEKINADGYEGSPDEIEGATPEDQPEEEETGIGNSEEEAEEIVDLFTGFFTKGMGAGQKQQFKERYKRWALPVAKVAGLGGGYGTVVSKIEKLPGPIRMAVGVMIMAVEGVWVRAQVLGQQFKETLQSLVGKTGTRNQVSEKTKTKTKNKTEEKNQEDWRVKNE